MPKSFASFPMRDGAFSIKYSPKDGGNEAWVWSIEKMDNSLCSPSAPTEQ
jgi:hypothetical protein